MPSENTIVERVKKSILKAYPSAFIYRPNDARAAGVADLFVFARGRCIVMEFKAPASEPRDKTAPWLQHDFSPLQVAFLKNIQASGSLALGVIHVISTGETWVVDADRITVRMTFDYVKTNGMLVPDDAPGESGLTGLVQLILMKPVLW